MKYKLYQIILLFILQLGYTKLQAADYYWKANTGDNLYGNVNNWDLNAAGSGIAPSIAPGPLDNVYFTIPPTTYTTIITSGGLCSARNIFCTANYSISITAGNPLNIYGSIFSSSGSLNFIGGELNLLGASAHTIDMGSLASNVGVFNCQVSISSAGGIYQLASDYQGQALNVVNGTFLSNGKNLRAVGFYFYTASIVNLEHSKVDATNFIFCSTTHSTTTTRVATKDQIYQVSSKFQSITVSPTTGTGALLLDPSVSAAADSLILNSSMYSISGSGMGSFNYGLVIINNPNCVIEVTGTGVPTGTINSIQTPTSSCNSRLTVRSSENPLNLKTSGLSVTNVDFYGIHAIGGTITDAGGQNLGFNNGITFTGSVSSTNFYWIGGAGNWDNPAHWSLTSGGSPNAGACIPTLADNVFFDASSFSSPGQIVTVTNSNAYCHNITFTDPLQEGNLRGVGGANALYISGSADFTKCKDIVLYEISFVGPNSETIWMGGHRSGSINKYFMFISCSGTYTLQDSLVIDYWGGATCLKFVSGHFNTNGQSLVINQFSTVGKNGEGLFPKYLDISNSTITITNYDWMLCVDSLKRFNAIGSHIKFINISQTLKTHSVKGYSIIRYHYGDVSFTQNTGDPVILSFQTINSVSFNDVRFMGNGVLSSNSAGDSTYFHDLYLTSGYKYEFYPGTSVYSFSGGLVSPVTPCQGMLTLQSMTPGLQAKLCKATGTFSVNGAMIKDVKATATVLAVNNGIDNGNNSNVTVSAGIGRQMYWVGGSGIWNDPSHWSIGTSGAAYPTNLTTNPNGCLPRPIDNVFFDANSFTALTQSVTINGNANCLNITWTSTLSPVFTGTSTTVDVDLLNVYGSLQLVDNMIMPFIGRIKFLSTITSPANTTAFKNVKTNAVLHFAGTGRWDLQDSIIMDLTIPFGLSQPCIYLDKGQLITNGKTIRTGCFFSNVNSPNGILDISNSRIYLYRQQGGQTYIAGSYSVFNAANSNIYMIGGGGFILGTNTPSGLTYHNLHFLTPNSYNVIMNQYLNMTLSFNKIFFNKTASCLFNDHVNTDTLILGTSQIYDIAAGKKLFVKDTIMGSGTPCNFTTIRSPNSLQPAFLQQSRCNALLYFYDIKNIAAVVSSSCVTNNYHVYGNNVSGNSNFNFHTIANLPKLGNTSGLTCKQLPFNQNTLGFGPAASYVWSTGSTNNTLVVTDAGSYSVTVTYAPNCYLTDSLRVTNTIHLDTTLTHVTCFNSNNGQAVIHPSGEAAPYTFHFGSANTFNQLNDSTINGLAAGSYYVVVTQPGTNTCKDSIPFTITQPAATMTLSSAQTNVICSGSATGAATLTVSGGTPAYTYSWTNSGSTGNTLSNVGAGTYVGTVTDSKTCNVTQTITITEKPALSVITTSITAACKNTKNGSVSIGVSGGTPAYHIAWNGGDTTLSITKLGTGNYMAIITDANGCAANYPVTIEEVKCIDLYIPQFFSPNSDGKNDTFEIKGLQEYPDNTISIFNRWGNLIYTKHAYNNDWDGKANVADAFGKGILPLGTYYVVLDFGDGETNPYHGFVQLQY